MNHIGTTDHDSVPIQTISSPATLWDRVYYAILFTGLFATFVWIFFLMWLVHSIASLSLE